MNILYKELELFGNVSPCYYKGGETRPKYRGLSHLICFYTIPYIFIYIQYQYVTSLIGLLLSCLIMSAMLCLFGISSHYHRLEFKTKEEYTLWSKLDHCSISYFIGCGMYPFGFLLMKTNPIQFYLYIGLNSIILLSSLVYNIKKDTVKKQTILQLVILSSQAITLFPFLYYIIPLLTYREIIYISFKYIVQLSGVLIYKYELFNCNKDIFGFHEVFHLFTIAGTICSFGFLSTICSRI